MQIERNDLIELLRSRNNEKTAQRAETSLPASIDLRRDRALLRRCGIEPNVLAVLLMGPTSPRGPSTPARVGRPVPEQPSTRQAGPVRTPLTLSSREVDEAIDGLTRAFIEPVRESSARHRQQRMSLATVVGQLMLAVGIVIALVGVPLGGAAVIAAAVLVIGIVHVARRRARVRTDAERSRAE